MVCLASSAVCYEPSGEADGALHEATLLLQITEANNETQSDSYQELGCLLKVQRSKLSTNYENNIVAPSNKKNRRIEQNISSGWNSSSLKIVLYALEAEGVFTPPLHFETQ